mgnify:CR=1 FL=1
MSAPAAVHTSVDRRPVRVIVAPYDSGYRGRRMGRGPLALVEAGLVERLRDHGHAVTLEEVEPPVDFPAEIASAFALCRAIATAVRQAVRLGELPVLLSGNCIGTVGVVAGLHCPDLALVWADAHGDLHTPETTTSGFLDGMALATAVGLGWTHMAASVPGFQPVSEARTVLAAAHRLDTAERELLRRSPIRCLSVEDVGDEARLAEELDGALHGAGGLHVHVDLDALDSGIARANGYAEPDGLRPERLDRLVHAAAERAPLTSVTLASYDPEYDTDGAAGRIALALLEQVVRVPLAAA